MPFVHGRATQVLLDGKDISAYLKSLDFGVDQDNPDVTTFSKSWKNFWPGLGGANVSAEGFYDPLMENIRQAVTNMADTVLTWTPGGPVIFGSPARLIGADNSTYKESSPVGGMVGFNWAAQADDVPGFGYVMHPLAAETITGTSTFLDGLAASTLGAVAHLHITAVAGTAPTLVVKFSDATTSGGAYTDIVGGAFTLANAVGAQRLNIPGTIRQFVKATWTITGSAGQSFTFATAFARKQ